jgi:hypothetical protein
MVYGLRKEGGGRRRRRKGEREKEGRTLKRRKEGALDEGMEEGIKAKMMDVRKEGRRERR